MNTLECRICHQVLPDESFSKAVNASRRNRHTRCKKCQSSEDKGRPRCEYRPELNHTAAAVARRRRWTNLHKYPEREAARMEVRRAIDRGDLIPASSCADCGSTPAASDGRRTIQAHHHQGYGNALSVMWLCPKCHRNRDAAMKGGAND